MTKDNDPTPNTQLMSLLADNPGMRLIIGVGNGRPCKWMVRAAHFAYGRDGFPCIRLDVKEITERPLP